MEAPPPRQGVNFTSYLQTLHGLQSYFYSIPRSLCLFHPLQLPSELGSKNFHCTLAPVSSIAPSPLAWSMGFSSINNNADQQHFLTPMHWWAGDNSYQLTRPDC